MKQKITAVIPARMGSRRFSGKVLYPYLGKPLLFYVWDEVRRANTIDRLLIATDWEPYAHAILEAMEAVEALENRSGPGRFAARHAPQCSAASSRSPRKRRSADGAVLTW